jgi:hypothetical protein
MTDADIVDLYNDILHRAHQFFNVSGSSLRGSLQSRVKSQRKSRRLRSKHDFTWFRPFVDSTSAFSTIDGLNSRTKPASQA